MVKSLPAVQETQVQSPGWGRSPGEGNGNPFQYSRLENLMDRGAWWATIHGVTWLKWLSTWYDFISQCKHPHPPWPWSVLILGEHRWKMISSLMFDERSDIWDGPWEISNFSYMYIYMKRRRTRKSVNSQLFDSLVQHSLKCKIPLLDKFRRSYTVSVLNVADICISILSNLWRITKWVRI